MLIADSSDTHSVGTARWHKPGRSGEAGVVGMRRTSVVAVGLEDQVMGYHHTVVADTDQVVEAGME